MKTTSSFVTNVLRRKRNKRFDLDSYKLCYELNSYELTQTHSSRQAMNTSDYCCAYIAIHCSVFIIFLQGNDEEYAECLVSKQLLIHELPPILILHMKRFHLGQQVTKNNNHIEFPDTLDVAPFCSDKVVSS